MSSTYKAPKQKNRRHELREDKVITFYSRFVDFFDENRNLVFGALGAIVLIIVLGFGYGIFKDNQEAKGQQALASAVRLYEKGSFREALDGANGESGLLDVADSFGSTQAGNLALFYAADAYYKLGEHESALTYFKKFDNGNDELGASAYAGEAAVLESLGQFDEAGDRYKDAGLAYDNEFSGARYLTSAGRAYEQAGSYADARSVYELIKQKYPESTQAGEVEMHLARVDLKSK